MLHLDEKPSSEPLSKPQTPSSSSTLSTDGDVSDPPPYFGDTASLASTRPVNLFYIVEKSQAIAGTWTVDPTLNVPQSLLLPEIRRLDKADNLYLYSSDKPVNAVLNLTSKVPSKSFLSVESPNGGVVVDIASRVNQKFCLRAESKDKNVTVYLPRDFEGPVRFRWKKYQPVFTDEISKRLTFFGRNEKEGSAFLGDWSNFGDGERDRDGRYAHWGGDELIVNVKDGGAKIAFGDEPRD